MSETFDHERLRVYRASIEFVALVEGVSANIERKVSARDHLGRASTGVPVNIAEASAKTSTNERCQFVDTAYGSALECAACLDVLQILDCISAATTRDGKNRLSAIVSMLIGFRQATGRCLREERSPYEVHDRGGSELQFDHERLDVYQKSLDFVRWCDKVRVRHCVSRPTEIILDKTSTGLVLNIAEGNGKFSAKDRCRFIEHGRTAALQAAATLDVMAIHHQQLRPEMLEGKGILADSVRMLVAWQRSLEGELR